MTEILFYHLSVHTLEHALPKLLERSLERGWNVVVQSQTEKVRDNLDAHLWSYSRESFLPHGREGHVSEGKAAIAPEQNPIWLTTTTENPNNATVRFMVDEAIPGDLSGYERVIFMFDGNDEDAIAGARERWKIEKSAGHDLTYWQQDEEGRWGKKA